MFNGTGAYISRNERKLQVEECSPHPDNPTSPIYEQVLCHVSWPFSLGYFGIATQASSVKSRRTEYLDADWKLEEPTSCQSIHRRCFSMALRVESGSVEAIIVVFIKSSTGDFRRRAISHFRDAHFSARRENSIENDKLATRVNVAGPLSSFTEG